MYMIQRACALVRGLLLAPEHHNHPTCRIELDHHVRPFIGDPDVVLFVDSYSVCVGPCIEIASNLAKVCAVWSELQELGSACTVSWTRGVATRKDENVASAVHCHTG